MSRFSIKHQKIGVPHTAAVESSTKKLIETDDQIEIGPTALAISEWRQLGLDLPNLTHMREYRLGRICEQLSQRDYAGALLFDPLNIRYATDSSNMHVWTLHNYARAVFVSADGYVVLWDFHGCEHLSAHLPLIKEIRDGAGFFYFETGDQTQMVADKFAQVVQDLMADQSGSNTRLAVDKMEIAGVLALQRLGVEICSGQQVMEHARAIKSHDEISAMRCSIATCEIAMQKMENELRPGICENELWSHLHTENIVRGGEWLETRILSSGPRTNPWMAESGSRIIQDGDIVAFDTDMIGPYGMCADLSRTWVCGDKAPTSTMREAYQDAFEHISENKELLKPGVSFKELTYGGNILKEKYRKQRYGVKMHGIGLCDEYPAIYYPEDFIPGAFDYQVEAGMTFCVEVYIGEEGADVGVKLEDQVLVTDTGMECLSHYQFDASLLNN